MKFHVGWKDRGMGRGDYGILDENDKLIAEVSTGLLEHAKLLSAAPSLLEGCEKALTCGGLDPETKALIEDAVSQTCSSEKEVENDSPK